MYQPIEEVLAIYKAEQKKNLTNSYKETITMGSDVTFTNNEGNEITTHFAGNETIGNINVAIISAKATSTDVRLTSTDGGIHFLAIEEAEIVLATLAVFATTAQTKESDKRNLVENSTTVEEVLAITWDSVE